ncbi:MAG: hypothetical protein ACOX0R_00615 [Candidatus Dojkabacteria bacterium]|jgi:competence protein ComGC
MKNKKTIIIIGIILIILVIGVVIFLFLNNKRKENYVITPIHQTSLSSTDKEISLKDYKIVEDERKFSLWEVRNDLELTKIKEIANDSGLELNFESDGYFYQWIKGEKFMTYNLETNTLIISGEDIIKVESSDLSNSIFSQLINQYFGFDWKYEVFETIKVGDNVTKYYAKRYIGENLMEKDYWDNQTDNIVVKDGKIISANLLLTQFTNTNKIIPLISQKELSKVINQSEYPKTNYFDFGVLWKEPNHEEMLYVSEEWEKIKKSVRDCKADKISIVYLYKDMSQKYLTPVYKIEAQCNMTYKGNDYFIPSTWYANAVNPELILTNDKK